MFLILWVFLYKLQVTVKKCQGYNGIDLWPFAVKMT
jgi:hypothetical protein